MLAKDKINDIAERLERAEVDRTAIPKITDEYPELTIAQAYDIQDALRLRKEARGIKVAGLKMGLTSKAKMEQMNVSEPVYGFLPDYAARASSDRIAYDDFNQPRIEAEIAVETKHELSGPGCDIERVMASLEAVFPAVEILDSRYRDFKFDLPSVVADNTSAAGYVIGRRRYEATDLNLAEVSVSLVINDDVVETGVGAAVLGHPAASVAMLANMLAHRGQTIPAGTFIMTGGMTQAVSVTRGDRVEARFSDFETLSFEFV